LLHRLPNTIAVTSLLAALNSNVTLQCQLLFAMSRSPCGCQLFAVVVYQSELKM